MENDLRVQSLKANGENRQIILNKNMNPVQKILSLQGGVVLGACVLTMVLYSVGMYEHYGLSFFLLINILFGLVSFNALLLISNFFFHYSFRSKWVFFISMLFGACIVIGDVSLSKFMEHVGIYKSFFVLNMILLPILTYVIIVFLDWLISKREKAAKEI